MLRPIHRALRGVVILLAAAYPGGRLAAAAEIDWDHAETVTVQLTDFAFTPNRIVLRAGAPVRLVLVNGGSGKHSFSAATFFAKATYKNGSQGPADGEIVLKKKETAEIDLVPTAPGKYELECTEFLHSFFGMTGQIDVAAPH